MKILEKLKMGFEKFEDLLFVECSCISCGIETDNSNKFLLCKKCEEGLIKINSPTCYRCGEILAYKNEKCIDCENSNYNFDKNTSFYVYDNISSKMVRNIKYYNKMTYSKYIARLMTQNLSVYKNVDYLTFVPLSNSGMKMRKFNQAEKIAIEIGKITGISVVGILNKDDGYKSQAELNKSERIQNLKNCFHLKDKICFESDDGSVEVNIKDKNIFKDKVIMIVDDVFTTGTTLSRCAEEIKKLHPKRVKSVTFAKTCRES